MEGVHAPSGSMARLSLAAWLTPITTQHWQVLASRSRPGHHRPPKFAHTSGVLPSLSSSSERFPRVPTAAETLESCCCGGGSGCPCFGRLLGGCLVVGAAAALLRCCGCCDKDGFLPLPSAAMPQRGCAGGLAGIAGASDARPWPLPLPSCCSLSCCPCPRCAPPCSFPCCCMRTVRLAAARETPAAPLACCLPSSSSLLGSSNTHASWCHIARGVSAACHQNI